MKSWPPKSLSFAAPKHAPSASDHDRAGSSSGRVLYEGQREEVVRPRVRLKSSNGTSQEVELTSYRVAKDPEQLQAQIVQAIAALDSSRRRASSKGFLSLSMTLYLELLDWTGRQLRSDKVESIPPHLNPILQRIGLDTRGWCDVVQKFGRIFKLAAGTPESLAGEACRRGQGWLCVRENPLGLSSV